MAARLNSARSRTFCGETSSLCGCIPELFEQSATGDRDRGRIDFWLAAMSSSATPSSSLTRSAGERISAAAAMTTFNSVVDDDNGVGIIFTQLRKILFSVPDR